MREIEWPETNLYECQMCGEKFTGGLAATKHRRDKQHLIRIIAKPENKKKVLEEILNPELLGGKE